MAARADESSVMQHDLSDKRALVVGASRGMGRAIAEAFVDDGATVAVAARSTDDLEELAAELGERCLPVECDLREAASVENAVDDVTDEFGGLDVVVNSAGVLTRGPLHETSEDELTFVVDVNLLGSLRLSKEVLPSLMDGGGTLLHVTSEAGSRGIENLPAYCASKGGVNTLVKQLAREYGPHGVSVNAIAPGTTKTSMNEEVRAEDPTWTEERAADIPLGRLGTLDDVSNLARFLASDASDYLSGEIIHIDGGATA